MRAAKRLAKSSRSSSCATVVVRARRNSSSIDMSSHSELKRTSKRSGRRGARGRPAPGSCGVRVDLVAGEHRPRRRAPARVAHARGVVADDQHDAMAEVLELAQLLQHDRVPEVDVGRRRVEPELDAQLAPRARGGRQLGLQTARRAGSRRRCGPGRRRRTGRGSMSGPMLVLPPSRTPAAAFATKPPAAPRPPLARTAHERRERIANITPLFGDRRAAPDHAPSREAAAPARDRRAARAARARLDDLRDDDGGRQRPARRWRTARSTATPATRC